MRHITLDDSDRTVSQFREGIQNRRPPVSISEMAETFVESQALQEFAEQRFLSLSPDGTHLALFPKIYLKYIGEDHWPRLRRAAGYRIHET